MERSLIAERVKEGMKLAAARGAKIGRPSVTNRAAFQRKWPDVKAAVLAGTLSQRKAAKHLGIGATTLKRLLEDENRSLQKGVAS